ncbi:hypothetical protein BC830DRAFT_1094664 [Chytriomyces sp. MP71]|nr:hypothetical protein BC830DRAFT_1094664 [Chytriomyces sp. MP71]
MTSSVIEPLYQQINSGWNTVKIVGITIIPYCWAILPNSFLWNTLMIGFCFDLLHCILVALAYSVIAYYPSQPTIYIWLGQALCAAGVRVVEIVYNGKLMSIMQGGELQVWQWIWFCIGGSGIIAGRVYDTLFSSTAVIGVLQVRIGLAIVCLSGVFSAIPVIYSMSVQLKQAILVEHSQHQNLGSSVRHVLQQAATRLIFVNVIDVGLAFYFFFPETVVAPYFRWWFDNWDNSRLMYYALDALLSKLLKSEKGTASQRAVHQQRSAQLTSGRDGAGPGSSVKRERT